MFANSDTCSGNFHNSKRHIKHLVCKSIKLFFNSVIHGHKRIFKTDKSQTERTGWANETEDAGYRWTNGKRPFPGQLPPGRFRKRRITPWPKAKRLSSGRTDAAGNYGTLLSGRTHLFSSVKYMPTDYRVRVANDLIYAPVHNWGGEVHPTVTPQMRRLHGQRYYQASGKA